MDKRTLLYMIHTPDPILAPRKDHARKQQHSLADKKYVDLAEIILIKVRQRRKTIVCRVLTGIKLSHSLISISIACHSPTS